MRKSIIYLAAFAFLFAASCQKEMEIIQAEKTDNETPEEEVVICSQKLVPITFEVNAETKVAIDGEHVTWETRLKSTGVLKTVIMPLLLPL